MSPTEDPGLVASTPKGSEIELDALEKIANAVLELKESAGEWRVSDDGVECGVCRATDATVWIAITGSSGYAAPLARAEFIATFDPPTILSLISAARKGQGEWRPIGSAPRGLKPSPRLLLTDGKLVLVGGRSFVCTGEETADSFWSTQPDSGWNPAFRFTPTHWMPLPPPSKQEE